MAAVAHGGGFGGDILAGTSAALAGPLRRLWSPGMAGPAFHSNHFVGNRFAFRDRDRFFIIGSLETDLPFSAWLPYGYADGCYSRVWTPWGWRWRTLLLNAKSITTARASPGTCAGEFFRLHEVPSPSLYGARLFPPSDNAHAATGRELPSFTLKGWGASPDKRRSIMMRNIATGLRARDAMAPRL